MANKAWDFTADTELQEQLANNLDKLADNFDEKVNALYEQIESMGTNKYWVGEDYEQFCLGTEGYKNAIKDLSNTFRLFANHTRKISEGTAALSTELINIVNTITNRGTDYSGTDYLPTSGDYSYHASGDQYNETVDPYSVNITPADGAESEYSTTTQSTTGSTPTNTTGTPTTQDNGTTYIPPVTPTGTTEQQTTTGDTNNGTTGVTQPEYADSTQKNVTAAPSNENGEQTYHNSGYVEYYTSNEYWSTFGDDIAENYKSVDLENGIVGAIFPGLFGTARTAVDLVIAAGDGIADGANDAIEGVQWVFNGLLDGFDGYEQSEPVNHDPSAFTNPYTSGYYSQIGEDFANDWDQFSDGYDLGDITTGVVDTALDVVQVAANAAIDTVQGVVEGVEWLWNCIGGIF